MPSIYRHRDLCQRIRFRNIMKIKSLSFSRCFPKVYRGQRTRSAIVNLGVRISAFVTESIVDKNWSHSSDGAPWFFVWVVNFSTAVTTCIVGARCFPPVVCMDRRGQIHNDVAFSTLPTTRLNDFIFCFKVRMATTKKFGKKL